MKKLSFEEAAEQLEETVSQMESGSMTLEQSIAAYENAVKLIGVCRARINECNQKLTVLKRNADGTMGEEEIK